MSRWSPARIRIKYSPPCANALIEAGIKPRGDRRDRPEPQGQWRRHSARCAKRGIEVVENILQKECLAVISGFAMVMTKHTAADPAETCLVAGRQNRHLQPANRNGLPANPPAAPPMPCAAGMMPCMVGVGHRDRGRSGTDLPDPRFPLRAAGPHRRRQPSAHAADEQAGAQRRPAPALDFAPRRRRSAAQERPWKPPACG